MISTPFFLRIFVADGDPDSLLLYTIPEIENHPGQRYTVPAECADSGSTT